MRTPPDVSSWPGELDRRDFTRRIGAGGKGANLGELVHAGLPVPPGFVLVTSAYRAFVAASRLGHELERALAEMAEGDPRSVEAASTAIRMVFERHPCRRRSRCAAPAHRQGRPARFGLSVRAATLSGP